MELITQVRPPQSGEGNKGERLVGAETSIVVEARQAAAEFCEQFTSGGLVRLSSPALHLPQHPPNPEAGGYRSLWGLSLTHNIPPSGPLSLAGPEPLANPHPSGRHVLVACSLDPEPRPPTHHSRGLSKWVPESPLLPADMPGSSRGPCPAYGAPRSPDHLLPETHPT